MGERSRKWDIPRNGGSQMHKESVVNDNNNRMETEGLLDDKNIELWKTLNSDYEIVIQKEKRSDYLSYSKDKKTIIYVPHDNLNSASFAHELLHVYLRSKKVFIGSGFALSIKENKVLSRIISEKLIEHVGNCLDHIKMYPVFIKLGYNQTEFIADYFVDKLTNKDIEDIKNHLVEKRIFRKVYNASAIDFFIGKFFAANACPNDFFDYKKQLEKLKTIDFELFQILETFMIAWKNFDYNDTDPISRSYNLLLFDFIDSLENWTTGKIII
jgi:hypothetical protein